MSSLQDFLRNRGFTNFEGYSQQVPEQCRDLIEIISNPSNLNMMEIGFNAGHSSELFLKNNANLQLTSFDIGQHGYLNIGKQYIDKVFENRHTLILGDSTKTIPKFINDYPNKKFDVIFIDGGHTYPVANADLINCKHLAHSETIVIMDDTMYNNHWVASWNTGPTQTWKEHILNKKVQEISRKDYSHGRGMSWGKYLF
jgi:predicted O-methyltransferase YrrM